MGSAEPAKPTVTVVGAELLIWLGGGAAATLLLVMTIKCIKKRKLAFSLRWLLLLMIAAGVGVGGIARRSLALTQAERYETELADFNNLPDNEKPAYLVTLTQPFYMGKYTVTQEQYVALIGNNPSFSKGTQLPVESVSWDDATEFCKKLNEVLKDTHLEAGLPTEAQWEYACRAGTRTRFYSGDSDQELDAAGWNISNSGGMTHPVGQLRSNMFGLYDMHGNVWQWCQDFYSEPYPLQHTTDPINTQGAYCVLRGGCWLTNPWACRASYRFFNTQFDHSSNVGFRVVMVPSLRTP
jgi:formylglycine-generating enzyme required for sulfatase activity